jgi:hypothetical protein
MNVFNARAKRVFGAIRDLQSYRLLWYALTSHPMPFKELATCSSPSGEFGMPDQTPDSSLVPRIVFQTWKSHHEMPNNYRYWRSTFIKYNPDFRCFLSDDDDNRTFIQQRFPWFLERYDSYPREIFRADVVRLFFLYVFGGFYADMDSECLRPLEPMRELGDVLVGRMGTDPSFEHSIPNAIMASKPGQMFWLLAIAFAAQRLVQFHESSGGRDVRPELLTGPVLLKDTVEFYTKHKHSEVRGFILKQLPELEPELERSKFGQVVILPPSAWYPVNWNNFIHNIFRRKLLQADGAVEGTQARKLFPHAYVVTYWSASWK